jgi:hypothetical protein
MNQLLDVDDLVQENKRQENNRLDVFENLLVQCHNLIKRHNKNRIREMEYTIPAFVLGKPKYNIDILRNYLVHHLRDNGLKVTILSPYHIYISWKEEDIDLSKFVHRKTLIDNRTSSLYMIDQVSHPRIDRSRIEMLKFRQEKQRQLQEERQQRFMFQKANMPPMPGLEYRDYLKHY